MYHSPGLGSWWTKIRDVVVGSTVNVLDPGHLFLPDIAQQKTAEAAAQDIQNMRHDYELEIADLQKTAEEAVAAATARTTKVETLMALGVGLVLLNSFVVYAVHRRRKRSTQP